MNSSPQRWILVAAVASISMAGQQVTSTPQQDTIYHNGQILTVDAGARIVEHRQEALRVMTLNHADLTSKKS